MKKFLGLAILLSVATASAKGTIVKLSDVTGKTTLIKVANRTVNGKAQTMLVDSAGLSLYTFDFDQADRSNCQGACLNEWPPQHAPANVTVAKPFGRIKGNDGQPQLTLNGRALYHYNDDKKPGDVFGQYPQWDTVVVVK